MAKPEPELEPEPEPEDSTNVSEYGYHDQNGFFHITEKRMKQENSPCGPKSKNDCVILWQSADPTYSIYRPVVDEFPEMRFAYGFSDVEEHIREKMFGHSMAVFYSPQNRKYTQIPANTAHSLRNGILESLAGNVPFWRTPNDEALYSDEQNAQEL